MPGKAAKVVVRERQSAILDEFRRSRTEPGWVVQRATVMVLAFEKWSNQNIAAEVGLDRMAVGLWREAGGVGRIDGVGVYGAAAAAGGDSRNMNRSAACGVSGDVHGGAGDADISGRVRAAEVVWSTNYALDT